MVSSLTRPEAEKHIERLVEAFFARIPSGVGREGAIRLSKKELEGVLTQGAKWAVKKGYGWNGDLEAF